MTRAARFKKARKRISRRRRAARKQADRIQSAAETATSKVSAASSKVESAHQRATDIKQEGERRLAKTEKTASKIASVVPTPSENAETGEVSAGFGPSNSNTKATTASPSTESGLSSIADFESEFIGSRRGNESRRTRSTSQKSTEDPIASVEQELVGTDLQTGDMDATNIESDHLDVDSLDGALDDVFKM